MCHILGQLYSYPRRQHLRLSYIRKIRLKFFYAYVFKNNFDEIRSFLIWLLHLSIFIFGIFAMRIYGINREIDLKVYYDLLVSVFKNSNSVDIVLNLYLIVVGALVYRYLMKYVLNWFRFHRIKIHLYLVKLENSYLYLIHKSCGCHIISYYSRLVNNIRFLLYNSGLKVLKVKSNRFSWDIERKENATPFELFFIDYLLSQNYRIHYHMLLLTFSLELFYNNFMLMYTYKVLPIVFIYEIWVRLSKTVDIKNITYDIALHHMIHTPVTHIDDKLLTFDTNNSERVYEKAYLTDIIKKYVRNDFKDKDMEDLYKRIVKDYHI